MILRLNAAECVQVLRDHCDNELLQHAVKVTDCGFQTSDDGALTFLFEFEEEESE